jgi:hypothetical protein
MGKRKGLRWCGWKEDLDHIMKDAKGENAGSV